MTKCKRAFWRLCHPLRLKCFAKFRKHDEKEITKPYTLNLWSRVGTGEEREYFIENLGMLIASGMDVLEAIASIQAEIRTPQMKKVVRQMHTDIENGTPIWKTFSQTGFLPDNIVSLIRIGEESGRLSENLAIVATQQQKARMLQSYLRTGIAYPLLVLSLTVIIGVGTSWFILPRLALVFQQLKMDLPLITKILLGFGSFLEDYGSYAVPLFFALLVAVFYFLFVYRRSRHIGQVFLHNFPVLKRLIQEVELSRFGSMLGMLLTADLSLTASLQTLEQATSFRRYSRFYRYLREQLEDGNSFFQAFATYPHSRRFIPSPIQQMIVSAEKSGGLSQTFLKIGTTYANKSENTTRVLSVLLEPLLLVIIWGGVVTVALAVILPIYSMVGGINTHQPTPFKVEQSNNNELLAQAQPQSIQLTENDAALAVPGLLQDADTLLLTHTPDDTALQNEPADLIEMSGTAIVPATSNAPVTVFDSPLPEALPISSAVAGEELTILSATTGFFEVILPDQSVGWIERSAVEVNDSDDLIAFRPIEALPSTPNIPVESESGEPQDTSALPEQKLDDATIPDSSNLELVIANANKRIAVNASVPSLRIRNTPSREGVIIGQAQAGETYKYFVHEDGWFQIEISPERLGWVTEQYVSKLPE